MARSDAGRRGRRSHGPGTDLGDLLAHQKLEIGGELYRVESTLKQHGDRSIALLATRTRSNDEFVIRAFDRESKAAADAGRKSRGLSTDSGVAAYVAYGAFEIDHPSMKSYKKKRPRLYGVVRPYQPYTLGRYSSENDLTSEVAVGWIQQIVRALGALHSADLVHGDLRPSNVLLTRDLRALVADYSLEPAVDRTDAEALYAISAEPSRAGDVYAFGKLARYLSQQTRDLLPSVRNRLDWVIAECLAVDPIDRPKIGDILDMLVGEDDRGIPFTDPTVISAAVADVDARRPLEFEAMGTQVRLTTLSTAKRLQHEVGRSIGFRLRELSVYERVHLLATLTMAALPTERATAGDPIGLLMVEGPPDPDWVKTPLDPLWMASIEQVARPRTPAELQELFALREVMPAGDYQLLLQGRSEAARNRKVALSVEARNALLQSDTFVRSEQVAALMSAACPRITTDEVRILRDLGFLLAVQIRDKRVYPIFQFQSRTGVPYASIKAVSDFYGSPQMSTWGLLGWWLGPHRLLRGQSPAAHLLEGGADGDIQGLLAREQAA